jgi:rubrerythrin
MKGIEMTQMAAPELGGVEVRGVTRATFILRGALAAGAAYGAAAAGPFVANAFASTASSDVQIVQFAYGLEQLEAAFYKAALAQAGLTGRVKALATEFGAHEAAHADTLKELLMLLGGDPGPPVSAKFDVKETAGFLKLAVTLEETGVSAYNGAATAIQSPDLLAAAGGIVNTEARHAAALRMLAGQDPAPDAFDKALTAQQVSARVKPFLTS